MTNPSATKARVKEKSIEDDPLYKGVLYPLSRFAISLRQSKMHQTYAPTIVAKKKKRERYYIPKNSDWSENAYVRDLKVVPDAQDVGRRQAAILRDPLIKGVMYPLTREPIQKTPQRDPPIKGVMYPLTREPIQQATPEPKPELEWEIGSVSKLLEESVSVHSSTISNDIKKFMAPDTNSFDVLYNEDDDDSYYYPAKNVSQLKERLRDLHNLVILDMLYFMGINWIRLKQRPVGRDGQYRKPESATSFTYRLIKYFNSMESQVLKYLDQAWYMIIYHRRSVMVHEDKDAQTGKAVQARLSRKAATLGPVRYFNPLFMFQNMSIDQLIYVATNCLEGTFSRRKVSLLSALSLYWKGSNDAQKKNLFDFVAESLKSLTIQSPLSVHFRAVSSQVLRQTKGSTRVTDHLSFSVLLTNPKPYHIYLLCGPLPPRLDRETREMQLRYVPMVKEATTIRYPNRLKVFINERDAGVMYDEIGDLLYPREVTEFCKFGDWNTFHLVFELDDKVFQKGMVLHVVQGNYSVGKIGLHKS
jgi:hypothetical protein